MRSAESRADAEAIRGRMVSDGISSSRKRLRCWPTRGGVAIATWTWQMGRNTLIGVGPHALFSALAYATERRPSDGRYTGRRVHEDKWTFTPVVK
jgi:hypothetical protein